MRDGLLEGFCWNMIFREISRNRQISRKLQAVNAETPISSNVFARIIFDESHQFQRDHCLLPIVGFAVFLGSVITA